MRIVLIDDDIAIRYSIKALIQGLAREYATRVDVYTSQNGVEGLGYIYVLGPEIILIDTTLPKYSGREVVEYLISHKFFHTREIVVLHENNAELNLPGNFILLNKSDKKFTQKLDQYLREKITGVDSGDSLFNGIKRELIQQTIKFANSGDKRMKDIQKGGNALVRGIKYLFWLLEEIIVSIYMTLLYLLVGKVHDANIKQKEKDEISLRVSIYPTLTTFIISMMILLFQLALFVGGGMVIFNTRLESIFALVEGEEGFEFRNGKEGNFIYSQEELEFTNEGVQLKGIMVEIPGSQPVPEEEPVEPEDVLGIDDEKVTTQTTYPSSKPFLITKNGVSYNNLVQILERSSINSSSSSIQESFINKTDTGITYQLSPDLSSWYYYNVQDDSWSKTSQGWSSSNTVQEVNKNLSLYEENFGSGELFLKIFLNSNGSNTPILKEVVVDPFGQK